MNNLENTNIMKNSILRISIPDEAVIQKIYVIRGVKIMIDRDLAEMYGVETKVLKQSVKRNISRFPHDFMFELSVKEFEILRSQFVTSRLADENSGWGGNRYLPMAFTEQGVAMLSSILNSDRAIQVNIQIIRIFTRMRELLSAHKDILQKLEQIEAKDIEQDEKILLIFDCLKQLEKTRQDQIEYQNRPRVGFKTSNEG